VQCPYAAFTSIQAAVDASGPNDTIKVCPGTYNEQVRIAGPAHNGLELESVKPLQAVIKWPLLETPPLALVDISKADRVQVQGFTITGPWTSPGCSFPRHEGVLIEQSFNDDIVGNHITEIRNSDALQRGCQEGDAVSVGARNVPGCGNGTLAGSARVQFNWIEKYQKNGVQDVNGGSFADVDHNLITGQNNAPNLAATNSVVVCSAGARVHHNYINGNRYTPVLSSGIILTGAQPGSILDHNLIVGNDYGIYADSESRVKITRNRVVGNFADAITLCGDTVEGCAPFTNSTVEGNSVDGNAGSGILLLGAASNLIQSNRVEKNGTALPPDMTDGIRANATSSDNQIRSNFMDDNVTHDCHDDSLTGNFWFGNRGETQNKPGLCTAHPHDDDD
jgi:parallel beta-helix repeat protein